MPETQPDENINVVIVVEGRLEPRRSGWFEGMTLIPQAGNVTRITGQVTDQAALFALISRIRDLGLKLISINRTTSEDKLET